MTHEDFVALSVVGSLLFLVFVVFPIYLWIYEQYIDWRAKRREDKRDREFLAERERVIAAKVAELSRQVNITPTPRQIPTSIPPIFIPRPLGNRGYSKREKYQDRDEFVIEGPRDFQRAVEKVLAELRAYAPYRYDEAVSYMNQAVYKVDLRSQKNPEIKAAGRSDGYFSENGTDFRWFRFVFLHEVGHCIAIQEHGDHSEKAADDYAVMVKDEMKAAGLKI